MSASLSASKRDRFIRKLIADTRAGEVEWHPESPNPPESRLSEHYINYLYRTTVAGKTIQLGEVRYPFFLDDEKFVFEERPVLEFCDYYGNIEWRFPSSSDLYELLDVARKEAFDVESAIDKYLESAGQE